MCRLTKFHIHIFISSIIVFNFFLSLEFGMVNNWFVQYTNLLCLYSENVEMFCIQNKIPVYRVVLLPASVFVSERGRETEERSWGCRERAVRLGVGTKERGRERVIGGRDVVDEKERE